jgi:hypothetical protein
MGSLVRFRASCRQPVTTLANGDQAFPKNLKAVRGAGVRSASSIYLLVGRIETIRRSAGRARAPAEKCTF